MLRNKKQSLEAIKKIARAMGDINDQVVYVGGAITGLYTDDPAAPEVRPTRDIDIVVKITSHVELEKLRQALTERGIQFAKEATVMCRFIYEDILLDVMSTTAVVRSPFLDR